MTQQDTQRDSMRIEHEAMQHSQSEHHHHHDHAASSKHPGHHHLLNVEELRISFKMYDPHAPFFRAKQHDVEVIRGLNISVHEGEIIAIVGASGSGKTLLADSIMGLFEPNATVSGTVYFDGERMDAAGLQKLRGHGISLVPQSIKYLDPLMKVGKQVIGLGAYDAAEKRRRVERQQELFAHYGLAPEVVDLYPFELSGGMARRVLLCCALIENPKLIIADEPTPGLDLELAIKAMDDFRAFADEGGSMLLITHDIELALRVADRIAIFKDGTVVEETAVTSFASPDLLNDPFSKELVRALTMEELACLK